MGSCRVRAACVHTRMSTNITLCWTNDYVPSLAFEQSTNLASAWLPVTNTPALTATNTGAIQFPLESGSRFFRVRLE